MTDLQELNDDTDQALARESSALAWGEAAALGDSAGEELARWRSESAGETLYLWGRSSPERAQRFASELIEAYNASAGERIYAGLAYLGALGSKGPLPFEGVADLSWESPGGAENAMRNIYAGPEYDKKAMGDLPVALAACAREAIESFYDNIDWYSYDTLTEGSGAEVFEERLSDWRLHYGQLKDMSWGRVAACVSNAFEAREIELALGAAKGEARASLGARI